MAFLRSLMLAVFLVLLSMKGSGEFDNTITTVPIDYPATVLWLRQNALSLSVIPLVLLVFMTKAWQFRIHALPAAVVLYGLSIIIFSVRTLFEIDPSKMLQGIALILVLVAVSSFYAEGTALRRRREHFGAQLWPPLNAELVTGVYVFFAVYVAANSTILALGYGYAEGVPRFFGITSHPNFVGTTCALGVGALVASSTSYLRGVRLILPALGLVIAGLLVVLASGSRTALLMALIGVAYPVYKSNSRWATVGFIMAILPLTIILATSSTTMDSSSVNFLGAIDRLRYEENTRQEVWQTMAETFLENPLFGAGALVRDSESSFLKIAATSGMVGLLPFMFAILSTAYAILKLRMTDVDVQYRVLVGTLALQFLASAFAEGSLMETAGIQVTLFILLMPILRSNSGQA